MTLESLISKHPYAAALVFVNIDADSLAAFAQGLIGDNPPTYMTFSYDMIRGTGYMRLFDFKPRVDKWNRINSRRKPLAFTEIDSIPDDYIYRLTHSGAEIVKEGEGNTAKEYLWILRL